MTKHSYSLMRPADFQRKNFSPEFSAEKFFPRIFSGKFFKFFSPEFSAENFSNFFPQNFQRKNFSAEFFPEFSAEKFFSKIFWLNFFPRIFSGKIFPQNFFSGIFRFFPPEFFQRNIFSASLVQELNLSGYPFHLTKAFFFFWSRRITFSIRKIF